MAKQEMMNKQMEMEKQLMMEKQKMMAQQEMMEKQKMLEEDMKRKEMMVQKENMMEKKGNSDIDDGSEDLKVRKLNVAFRSKICVSRYLDIHKRCDSKIHAKSGKELLNSNNVVKSCMSYHGRESKVFLFCFLFLKSSQKYYFHDSYQSSFIQRIKKYSFVQYNNRRHPR